MGVHDRPADVPQPDHLPVAPADAELRAMHPGFALAFPPVLVQPRALSLRDHDVLHQRGVVQEFLKRGYPVISSRRRATGSAKSPTCPANTPSRWKKSASVAVLQFGPRTIPVPLGGATGPDERLPSATAGVGEDRQTIVWAAPRWSLSARTGRLAADENGDHRRRVIPRRSIANRSVAAVRRRADPDHKERSSPDQRWAKPEAPGAERDARESQVVVGSMGSTPSARTAKLGSREPQSLRVRPGASRSKPARISRGIGPRGGGDFPPRRDREQAPPAGAEKVLPTGTQN